MKLVDILARDLKVWPDGLECLSQLQHNGSIINGKGFDGRVWNWLEIAEDTHPAGVIVTRAQWQEAVDALKAEKVVEWNGEGLPPVGVDALLAKECKFTEGTRLDSFPAGTIVYVGGHANFGGCDLAVIIIKGRHFCGTIIPELLNPIRTPEQIAAEEREENIKELYFTINWNEGRETWPIISNGRKADYAKAIDAGYRKQVAP